MEPVVENTKQSSAQEFVNNLLTEGSKAVCDESCEDYRHLDDLPPFYDEELFKKGQQFFHKHLFAFFFSNCLGLIAVLSVPSILKVLMFTKMSGSEMTSYRRYVATIMHMIVWYDSDFKPGSKLWRSLAEVRNRHNSASKRSCLAGMSRITQRDMTLTQFGFLGIGLCRSKMTGIHNASEEEWKGCVHLWRVIGHLVGIEDRFNLCNGTVEETRERCNVLIEQVFRPNIEQKDEDFINMSRYMVVGLWSLNIFIKFESMMCYLHMICQDVNNNKKLDSSRYSLTPAQKPNLDLLVNAMYMLSWTWFRIFQNYSHRLTLWFMRVLPILAFYQFGFSNARVRILVDKKNK